MRAKTLHDLLKKGDRIAVSNITGREAGGVSITSQKYSPNIIGGWALGKGGEKIAVSDRSSIPVFSDFGSLLKKTSKNKYPNKAVVYSPPQAVYGDVKEIINCGEKFIETIFIITEHVSIEVTSKIHSLALEANVDVIGCNTLGVINTMDHVRVGAVGGDNPEESFKKGTVSIISNSGNMVNTMSSYLLSAGLGTSFGISTGKDALILTPLLDFLKLAEKDENTKLIVLYIEPGGLYEFEAIESLKKIGYIKPIVVYVTGKLLERKNLSLGHAGAVIEGNNTSASAKMRMFDEYFEQNSFDPKKHYKAEDLKRGIRITALHHLPQAAQFIYQMNGWNRDYEKYTPLRLNPWCINLGKRAKKLSSDCVLSHGNIPQPYRSQLEDLERSTLGATVTRTDMRNRSHASYSDGHKVGIYGQSLTELMEKHSFIESIILYWAGGFPKHEFETKLVEMSLTASLTNGPGTISAQGAKLSTSAGNNPNTAMISTLACIGTVHGGNGRKATEFLIKIFRDIDFDDPYEFDRRSIDIQELALKRAKEFMRKKLSAKDAGIDYERIPCIGHPVFRGEDINYDPREKSIYNYLKGIGKTNIFLEFYHLLVHSLKAVGATRNVFAVNLDAAIACIWLGICWNYLKTSKITIQRVLDIPFLSFALGRAAGGAGEFLDHQDYGSPMDMRIPVSECKTANKD
ncbi:hypothetical protein KAW08_00170 [bacterium]|nr:hypothetical protein [bacterium]